MCHNCRGSAKDNECSICSKTEKVLSECSRYLKKLHRQCHKVIYVNISCDIVQLINPFSLQEKVQAVKVQIKKEKMKPIDILAIYRVSTTPSKFIEELETEINNNISNETVIFRDLNIDQLSSNNDLKLIFNNNSVQQIICEPTRITEVSKSLIDLIIVNRNGYQISGVIRSALSDHDLIYTVRIIKQNYKSVQQTRIVRDFSKADIEATRKSIEDDPWWTLDESKDF